MTARADIPAWPYRMKAELAAAYCGAVSIDGRVSVSTFRAWVARKEIREGTAHGGNVFWYRDDLEEDLDRLRGRGAPSPAEGGSEYSRRLRDVREAEARS